MATGACSACDYSPVALDVRNCPRCGAANPNPGVANRLAGPVVFLGMGGGVLVGAVLGWHFGGPGGPICGGLLGAIPGLCAGLVVGLVLSLVTKATGEPVTPRRGPAARAADPGRGPPVPLASVTMGKRTATVTIPRAHPLPTVCVVCGGPATGEWSRTFAWTPAWAVPLVLVGSFVSREVTLSLPVCGCRGRRHWRAAKLFAAGVAVATAVGAVGYYGVSITDPDLGSKVIVGAVLFGMASGVAALMVTADPIGLRRADDFGVTLDGVSHGFARALTPGGGPRAHAPADGVGLMTAKYFRP